jgi:hypothetical protein
MKMQLSPVTIGVVIAVVVLAIAGAFWMSTKPQIGEGPPLTPKKWAPPSQWAGAPGANGASKTPGKL